MSRGRSTPRRSSLLAAWPHAFTGTGEGDFRPVPGAGLPPAGERLVRRLGAEGPLVTVSQVHGARVVDLAEAERGVEADAIVSTLPGRLVAVRVADCVPILLAAPNGVVAVHAGWRGTSLDIARVALRVLCDATGAHPGEVRAAIGPAICGGCYQVGDEVRDAVSAVAPGKAWWRRDGAALRVDLRAANAAILAGEGVRVSRLRACTRCTPGFWSHRRDGPAEAAGGPKAGRQVGAIARA